MKKKTILKNISYTELVYHRINKKLKSNYSKKEIEEFIYKIIEETPTNSFHKKGKNYYIQNIEKDIKITVNSSTFSIITVDKLKL